MNEICSPSNVQARASSVRPTWSNAETRINTGSVQPVQPVQRIFRNYRIKNLCVPSCEWRGRVVFSQKVFTKIRWTGWTGRTRPIYQELRRTSCWTHAGHTLDGMTVFPCEF